MVDFDSIKMDIEVARVKAILLQREYSYEQLLNFAALYCVSHNAQHELVNDCMADMNSVADTFRAIGDKQELRISEGQKIMLDLLEQSNKSMLQGLLKGIAIQKISHAKKGAIAKKAQYKPLKELAEKLVNGKNFKSRRQAAITITPAIVAKSRQLNIPLSETQAEITITGWLKEMGLPANIKL